MLYGPLDIAWICCPQLPHHPHKNETHSTCFYSTGGHTPIQRVRKNHVSDFKTRVFVHRMEQHEATRWLLQFLACFRSLNRLFLHVALVFGHLFLSDPRCGSGPKCRFGALPLHRPFPTLTGPSPPGALRKHSRGWGEEGGGRWGGKGLRKGPPVIVAMGGQWLSIFACLFRTFIFALFCLLPFSGCHLPEELQKPQPLLVSKKVLQYISNLYGSTPPSICIAVPSWLLALKKEKPKSPPIHLPSVLQYASHLYSSMPPICTEVLLRKYWGLGSPESSCHLYSPCQCELCA